MGLPRALQALAMTETLLRLLMQATSRTVGLLRAFQALTMTDESFALGEVT